MFMVVSLHVCVHDIQFYGIPEIRDGIYLRLESISLLDLLENGFESFCIKLCY